MTADTTVPVSDEVWQELMLRKDRGDTFDDVLRRVLEIDSDETGVADDTTNDKMETNANGQDDVVENLDEWKGIDVDDNRARKETQRAISWLRESNERQSRQDFVAALAEDSPFGERTYWERAVQPGLSRLDEIGAVEYRAGHHDYRWVGGGGW